MQRWSSGGAALALIASALLGAACAGASASRPAAVPATNQGASASAAASPALTALKYQHSWVMNAQAVGYLVAVEQGFYGAEGLDVEIIAGGPNVNPVQTVMGGVAPVGAANAQQAAAARAQGLPIKAIGALYQKAPSAIVCRADAGVEAPADLVGKRVGAGPKDRPLIEAALTFAGVDPGRVELSATGADLTPILAKQIDCRYGFISNEPNALELKGVPTHSFLMYDLGLKQQGGILFTTEEAWGGQRDALQRFVRGSANGWQWAFDHPEDATRLLLDKASDLEYEHQLRHIKGDAALAVTPYSQQHGLYALDADIWREWLATLQRIGELNRPVTVEEMLVSER